MIALPVLKIDVDQEALEDRQKLPTPAEPEVNVRQFPRTQKMQTYDMEEGIPFTVRYMAKGASIAEDYQSALGAIGRVGALVSYGIGSEFAIWSGPCVLMDQAAIFESLRLTRH